MIFHLLHLKKKTGSSIPVYPLLVFFIACLSFLSAACNRHKYPAGYFLKLAGPVFPYDLGHPYKIFQMPEDLQEISGLEYYRDGIIACNEDEHGYLFLYDTKSGRVIRKIHFAKHGDYESVALSGDYAWLMTSNGKLFGFPITADDKVEATEYLTPLTKKNNVEGMCYYPADSSLLIACKDAAGIHSKKGGRAVYRFHLADKQFETTPFIHLFNKVYLEKLDSMKLPRAEHTPFKPSGIAIQPDSGYIYWISSIGKLLVVLNRERNIQMMAPLDRSMFQQPEGITFSPEGDMFISSEGDFKNGLIVWYKKIK